MSGLMDLVTRQLGTGGVQQLGGRLGIDDKKTQMILAAAMPVLVAALAKNASKDDGAASLHGAIQRDHDGSALDNLAAAFGRQDEGTKILGHILGGRQGRAESSVGRAAGVDAATAAKLMALVAPVLMGALGRTQREQNLESERTRRPSRRSAARGGGSGAEADGRHRKAPRRRRRRRRGPAGRGQGGARDAGEVL